MPYRVGSFRSLPLLLVRSRFMPAVTIEILDSILIPSLSKWNAGFGKWASTNKCHLSLAWLGSAAPTANSSYAPPSDCPYFLLLLDLGRRDLLLLAVWLQIGNGISTNNENETNWIQLS